MEDEEEQIRDVTHYLAIMEDEEEQIRDELSGSNLDIAKGVSLMFDNIDHFVALSRDNGSVNTVRLCPFDSDPGNYEVWDKVGQIVGNCIELESINICFVPTIWTTDEDPSPDWEILARILRYLRRKVTLSLFTEDDDAEVEEIQGLARVIHYHPMISEFYSLGCTFETLNPWCSVLATLPSLEFLRLGLREPETGELEPEVNPEPLKELLRAPALRCVIFDEFYFTNTLCHAVANALEERSPVTDINFVTCSFPDGGIAIIANALKRNASVTNFKFLGDFFDDIFCSTLAAVLQCNSTLQNLTVDSATPTVCGRWFSSIFLSLGMNITLKSLTVGRFDMLGDELCAAIRSGLAKNSSLEELSLTVAIPSDDDGALSAHNALSFLRTNSTLKSLTVSFVKAHLMQAQKDSQISAFRLEAVKMVEETPFLESLTIHSCGGCKFEEWFTLISALELNTTLKTLGLQSRRFDSIDLVDFTDDENIVEFTVDEVNQLVSILMKNYGLECLVPDISCADDRTVKAILRLNGAGRRYLINDESSISKGVEVLSAVNDDINCMFLHLLENPSLCDRRTAETTTSSRRPGANLGECSSTGKRERAQS